MSASVDSDFWPLGSEASLPATLPCAVCGGCATRELLCIRTPDRFERAVGVPAKGYKRTWLECAQCGAATNVAYPAVARALDAIAGNYYEIDIGTADLRARFDRIMALPASRSDNAGRVRRISQFMSAWVESRGLGTALSCTSVRRVLDVGAGLGVFLSAFLQTGWEGDAVEPDPHACEHLRRVGRNRFGVIHGLFVGQPELRDYDLLTLNKVVEHLPDPVGLLRSAQRALRPGGVLYVEVPDKLTITYRPPTDNILGALHRHLYDPRSLATLFEAAEFTPFAVSRVFEPSGKITVCGFAVGRSTSDQLARISTV